MGPLKTGRHDSLSMWEIAAMAMNPDPEITDEVRARCRAVWAEYAAAVGGRRMFAMSHGLLKRTGVDEIDEQAEAERQHGEFVPYVAADATVYSAADKAGAVPELKGLLASQARPEILATVLSRRLGRPVHVELPQDVISLPLLRMRASASPRRGEARRGEARRGEARRGEARRACTPSYRTKRAPAPDAAPVTSEGPDQDERLAEASGPLRPIAQKGLFTAIVGSQPSSQP